MHADTLPVPTPAATPDLVEVLRSLVAELRRSRAVEPELIAARDAALLAGLSPASWHRLHAAAKTPKEVRLAGSVRWRRSELLAWIGAGCPDRTTWDALRKGGRS